VATQIQITEGQILTGSKFSEPMRVETVKKVGRDLQLGLVGHQSERFKRVLLTSDDLSELSISDPVLSFEGNGQQLQLALQAYSLGIAYEFDPYFGLSLSHVDPLPHQIEAVYEHLLKTPRVRFLLADDAGAGKTIMAGLLVRELKLRGIIERILVVCPANLSFQWQRELKEKFDEKFLVFKGRDIRDQFGVNQWMEQKQVITSLDLAKRDDILPGLRQVHWDLVIIDEAHRMSARDKSDKSQRYRLGELLRDSTDHILLLTATPHKGDPKNFTLFLELLDQDVYADVKSIQEAMNRKSAPFYLRRTKESMVYFPELQLDGSWATLPVFTKRIPHTAGFTIQGSELNLYKKITKFVKNQSRRVAGDNNPRARAVGFLMSLYQRRLASSIYAIKRSLEKRAKRLEDSLQHAENLSKTAPPNLPTYEELEEYEDVEKERLEELLDAVTLTGRAEDIREEIVLLLDLAEDAQIVQSAGTEAKLQRLEKVLRENGFFDQVDQRLLIFTEFKDTLEYLVEQLEKWGFKVGYIHGSMKPGSRDEPGTRLFVEQNFREGIIQVLVATEAAGEGINLQCCNILFNYDIPWNPNRLEQRMGRIHRYGQQKDCLIFNFVAQNTIEGRVLDRLLEKLQEIRDALDDDAVFNVIGEVLPSKHIEQVLRNYYAGELGDNDLEETLLKDVDEKHFRDICQTALEGLATKKLNLDLLKERQATAQERRVIPETIARFLQESAKQVNLSLNPIAKLEHAFQAGPTPQRLKKFESDEDWSLSEIANKYSRLSTDRHTAEKNNIEWVHPGHPLFEALRRSAFDHGQDALAKGACFFSLAHENTVRLDFYKAQVVDGLGKIIHERLFVVELAEDTAPTLCGLSVLGDMTPTTVPEQIPLVANLPEELDWVNQNILTPFRYEVQDDRIAEINRISEHVEISLFEVISRIDLEIGKADEDKRNRVLGAEARLAKADKRHAEASERLKRRRGELKQQRSMTLQGVHRMASVLVLPHPDRKELDLRRLRPHPETEMTAMRVVIEYEKAQGREVKDVHKENLGYDITSRDPVSGELRLIEIKGLANPTGSILLTPNERRVAEDRRDCFWLYIVTNCATSEPELRDPIKDPARFPWEEVIKVQHYYLDVSKISKPINSTKEDFYFKELIDHD